MRFCRTAKSSKRGVGLTDFFAILALAFIFLVFYVFFKIFIGHATFQVKGESVRIEGYESVTSILRTPATIDGNDISIAELIVISGLDESKKGIVAANLVDIMDKTYGTAKCAMMCVNDEKYKGSGCDANELYQCPDNLVFIPGYDNQLIKVAFESDINPLKMPIYVK